jgi:hypothetical protein
MNEHIDLNLVSIEDELYNSILTAYEKNRKIDKEAYDLLIQLMQRISNIFNIDPDSKNVLRNAIVLIINLFFDSQMEFGVLNKKDINTEDLQKIKQMLQQLVVS